MEEDIESKDDKDYTQVARGPRVLVLLSTGILLGFTI